MEHPHRVARDRERQCGEAERCGEEEVDRESHDEAVDGTGVGPVLPGHREHCYQPEVGCNTVDLEVGEQRRLQHDADDDDEGQANATDHGTGTGG